METSNENNIDARQSIPGLSTGSSLDNRKLHPNFLNKNSHLIVLAILILGFAAFSVFFAVRLRTGRIPDESYHFPLSQLFSTTWGIPANTPNTFYFSYIDHKPFLYYWINGRALNLLHLVVPDVSRWRELVFLRLLSVVYSLGTVIFLYLLAKEFIEDKWGQVFATALLTTTLMFVFLSGGVNYDNLTNLCCMAGIYFFTRTVKGKDFYKNSLLWLITISFGTLVKVTALPLAAILTILWGVYVFINRRLIVFKKRLKWQFWVGMAVFVFLCIGNIAIYGVNIIKYGNPKPPCDQVLTEDQCANNLVYVRNTRLQAEGSLTFIDVLNGEGDEPLGYFSNYWGPAMLQKIYGILGNKVFYPSDFVIRLFGILAMIGLLSVVRYWKAPSFPLGALYITFAFYVIVLFVTNYRAEMRFWFKHIGIQGRYLFPIIGAAYVILSKGIFSIRPILLKWLVVILVLVLFLTTFLGVLLPNIPSLVVQ